MFCVARFLLGSLVSVDGCDLCQCFVLHAFRSLVWYRWTAAIFDNVLCCTLCARYFGIGGRLRPLTVFCVACFLLGSLVSEDGCDLCECFVLHAFCSLVWYRRTAAIFVNVLCCTLSARWFGIG